MRPGQISDGRIASERNRGVRAQRSREGDTGEVCECGTEAAGQEEGPGKILRENVKRFTNKEKDKAVQRTKVFRGSRSLYAYTVEWYTNDDLKCEEVLLRHKRQYVTIYVQFGNLYHMCL